ncbi:hypothetical protein [Alteribacter aurantiacus]|uniref:hypothetical protein n=1 Tax=Alteribacter aurantiacus TaxID=254410 RepID=UPI0004032BDC|nr:hypothetical protein [Alteribacter aurantiacus]
MKKLQAYYRTQNDAESASISLKQLEVSNVMVDEIPEASRKELVLVPAANIGSSGTAGTGVPPVTAGNKGLLNKNDKSSFEYILEFDVSESDYEQAVAKLKETDAHIDRPENE